ncbi:MAG: HAD hydrolase-like protein [Chloroflexi bacterium]|jgi:putative hydrolase of the HAD superfamily|nr:HAD hydrolase-like protein [Chloroflexota bacterium]
MSDLDLIAFDADDTLWHNESKFAAAQANFRQMMAAYHPGDVVDEALNQTERENIHHYGYGVKSYTLSLIETAIRLTDGQLPASVIQKVLDGAKEMITDAVEPLEHVEDVLAQLKPTYPLMLLTKGDLFEQDAKIAKSGLASYFTHIEVVSEKNAQVYAALLEKYGIAPARFLMVGNSLRSDILPIVEIGGHAVHIPYHITWVHEVATPSQEHADGYEQLEHIGQLPALLAQKG